VGHYDPSIVAGDGGELALAYYEGVPRSGKDPAWFVRAARVSGAAGPGAPAVVESSVSDIPAYAQSPNAMGGSCSSGPLAGLENGLACDRASDDWGIALDAQCLLTVTFPTVKNDAPGADAGTFVSTQVGGSRACGNGQPSASPPPLPPPTTDTGPPALRRRIKIAHIGGKASKLRERSRRLGYVPLRAKVVQGVARGARAFLYRRVHGKLRLVARSGRAVRLTTSPRTLRMKLVHGAPPIAPGRYLSVVSGTIARERVTRARPFSLGR
jgi:hypothetical protein